MIFWNVFNSTVSPDEMQAVSFFFKKISFLLSVSFHFFLFYLIFLS
jgi:hypothetical protein